MNDAPITLPADLITLGAERPLRMAVAAPPTSSQPMIEAPRAAETRVSAVPSYAAAISFDWRRDEPMASSPAAPGANA